LSGHKLQDSTTTRLRIKKKKKRKEKKLMRSMNFFQFVGNEIERERVQSDMVEERRRFFFFLFLSLCSFFHSFLGIISLPFTQWDLHFSGFCSSSSLAA